MERVVVTGMGSGHAQRRGPEPTWNSLLAGQSAAGPITLFEADERYASRFACEVKNFDPADSCSGRS